MQKIWVCGARGQIGQAVNDVVDKLEFEMLDTDVDDLDVTDTDEVLRFGEMNRPDIIINCSGMTDISSCEENPSQAFKVNALGARNLAIVAAKMQAKMVQLSTDDVFDGRSTEPYTEFDLVNPGTVYGKSKLAGENYVKEFTTKHFIVAFLVACVVAMLFGAFNGALVAYFKIQPMVATLILYTAGRSIAAWINNNELPIVSDPTFSYFGGFIPGIPIPTPFFIAAVCVLVIFLVLKFTTLGLYTQSVGINENSSKLNGLNPTFIKFLTFVILGLCVAVAALIKVSRLSSINYSVIAKDIEMDAILAVALGGNSLSGGKFNMAASILGAYVIQFLTTTLYKFDVQSDALPAYKAVVVILLVVLSTPKVREWLSAFGKKLKQGKAVKEVG